MTSMLLEPQPEELNRLRLRVQELEILLHDKSDPFLHNLFDTMLEGVQILSSDWRYLYVNLSAAEHGRRNREELLGRSMPEMYPGIENTELFALMKRCLAERQPQRMLNDFAYPDGRHAWFELRLHPCPQGLLILSLDVTSQILAQAELRRGQRLESLGRLAAGVAHDFNNFVMVINGFSEMALAMMGDQDPAKASLSEIRRAGEMAASLTRQLMAFGKAKPAKAERIPLAGLIDGMMPMLRSLAGENVELSVDLEPALEPALADSSQLEQVLLNLCLNARDAMPGGGRIRIRAQRRELDAAESAEWGGAPEGSYLALSVSDNGVGMDAATRELLFEPFFTTKEPGKGTGLGLSSVYGIARQSGGGVRVWSEPGQGTEITVLFPVAAPGAAGAGELPAGVAPPSRPGRTILVVDDQESILRVVRAILEKEGYLVLCADGPVQAQRLFAERREDIDLLLTDLVLTRLSGMELANRLRQLKPRLKLAFMSGHSRDQALAMGELPAGAVFLEKPLSVQDLVRGMALALA